MDKDKIYLEEIKEFGQKVIGFTAGISHEQFTQDEKLQFAVVKLIENIGEASKRVSQPLLSRRWRDILPSSGEGNSEEAIGGGSIGRLLFENFI